MYPQAIWENQFYYLFGFLFLVFIILVVSCSQISIVMVYFQLCAEVRGMRPALGGRGSWGQHLFTQEVQGSQTPHQVQGQCERHHVTEKYLGEESSHKTGREWKRKQEKTEEGSSWPEVNGGVRRNSMVF